MARMASMDFSDATYPAGTVVCFNSVGLVSLCTHDNCPFSFIVSPDMTDGPVAPVTQAGEVSARTAFDLVPRTFVVSDGRGGVRAVAPSEAAYAMGYTIGSTVVVDGVPQVSVVLKSFFGVLT